MPKWAIIITGMAIIIIVTTATANGVSAAAARSTLPAAARGYRAGLRHCFVDGAGRNCFAGSVTEMRIPFRARTV
jgi:hypothetical protein